MRRFAILALALELLGCDSRPDADQRAKWRKQAQEADAKIAAEAKKDDPIARWQFRVTGQVERPATIAVAEIPQQDTPVDVAVGKTDVYAERRFRGIRLSSLIDHAGPAASATSATILANDGYFATLELEDIRNHAFILAYEQDGQPSLPAFGGPLSVRYDSRGFSAEMVRRTQSADVFYVTHLIVGNESASLRVGERVFDEEALGRFTETIVSGPVSYRSGWEATPQSLHGIRLRDILHATGLADPLPRVQVFGKAELHQRRNTAPTFTGDAFDSCEPLLIRHYGIERTPVPTRRGGPLLLYVNPTCREQLGANAWLSFVERVEVR